MALVAVSATATAKATEIPLFAVQVSDPVSASVVAKGKAALQSQAVPFESVSHAFEGVGSVKMTAESGETIRVTLRDQMPVVIVDGDELSTLQIETNAGVIEIHSMSVLHPDLLVTRIALDRTGRLVVTSDVAGNNGVRFVAELDSDNMVRLNAPICTCFGGDSTSVKIPGGCPNINCDNAGTSCVSAGSIVYCQYRGDDTPPRAIRFGDIGWADR